MFVLLLVTTIASGLQKKQILGKEFISFSDKSNFSLQQKCPVFSKEILDANQCLQVNSTNIVFSSCPDGKYCNWNVTNPQNTWCEDESKVSTLKCPKYVRQDEECSEKIHCKSGLYCVYENETSATGWCEERKLVKCTHLHECDLGSVCNQGNCIAQLSLPQGSTAETRLACESGLIRNGTCQASLESTGGVLPKACNSSDDCVGSDNATSTKCVCVPNKGSFCQLHPSDSLIKSFLQASFEDRQGEARWLFKRIFNYPIYEFENEYEDYIKKAVDYQNYIQIKEMKETCFGTILKSLGLLLLINI